jgi:hypothetical protein
MTSRQFQVVISLRNGGGILVERQEMFGKQWKTIDRYNTHDLTAELRRDDPWIAEVIALCSQPSADISIVVPPIPKLLPTQAERLEAYEREAREREMLAQHDAEFKLGMDRIVNDERYIPKGEYKVAVEPVTGPFVPPLQSIDHAERYEL